MVNMEPSWNWLGLGVQTVTLGWWDIVLVLFILKIPSAETDFHQHSIKNSETIIIDVDLYH